MPKQGGFVKKAKIGPMLYYVAGLLVVLTAVAGGAIAIEKVSGAKATSLPLISDFSNVLSSGWNQIPGFPKLSISSEQKVTTDSKGNVVVINQGQTGTAATQTTSSSDTTGTAALQFTVINAIGLASVTSGTSDFDVWNWNGGNVDWLSPVEKGTTINSAPELSTLTTFKQGDELVIHVRSQSDPTNGEDFYDEWYYVKLNVGENIRFLNVALESTTATIGPIARFGGTTYTKDIYSRFTDGLTYTVTYTGSPGQTRQWDLGKIGIWPRSTDANNDIALTWGATTMSSVTDGSSWDNTLAEQDNDVTLNSDNENMYITINQNAVALTWGRPIYVIDQSGKIHMYPAVAVISTNATSIGQGVLTNEGWKKLPSGTTGDIQFGKAVTPIQGTQTVAASGSIKIPIDANALAASTAYDMAVWLIDAQNWEAMKSDVRAMTTSVPTAYGLNGYGLAAINGPQAYSESSGNPATAQLYGDWTTAA